MNMEQGDALLERKHCSGQVLQQKEMMKEEEEDLRGDEERGNEQQSIKTVGSMDRNSPKYTHILPHTHKELYKLN